MPECEACEKEVDMPFTCRRCGKKLCGSHRLPESHTCPGQAIDVDLEKGVTRRQPAGKLSPHQRSGGSANPLKDDRSALYGGLLTVGTYLLLPLILAYQLLAWAVGWTLRGWRPVLVVGLIAGAAIYGVPGVNTSGVSGAIDNAGTGSGPGDVEEVNQTLLRQELHDEVNNVRLEQDVHELGQNELLHNVAEYHSEDMVEGGYYSHTSPSGESMTDRYEKFDIDCKAISGNSITGAENLAETYAFVPVDTEDGVETFSTEEEIAHRVVEMWLNSPRHREILLDSDLYTQGFGVATEQTENGVRVLVTQNFC